MAEQVKFLEIQYGRIFELDLHGLTKGEANAQLVHTLNTIDSVYKAVLVTHGYHKGTVLKNFVRGEFSHPLIAKKINIDASRTLLVCNWSY